MNCMEKGSPRSLADKIKAFREGNRVTVSETVNVQMTFARRNSPEEKIGTLGVNGSFGFTLFDAALAMIAVAAVLSVLRTIRSLFRRF